MLWPSIHFFTDDGIINFHMHLQSANLPIAHAITLKSLTRLFVSSRHCSQYPVIYKQITSLQRFI